MLVDDDGRTYRILCNRCNAEWPKVRCCPVCRGVEFRLVEVEEERKEKPC